MSLQMVFDKDKARRIKQTMPVELLVYKIAILIQKEDRLPQRSYTTYISPFCATEYSGGEQCNEWDRGRFHVPLVDQPGQTAEYYPGFHSFTQKSAAMDRLEKSKASCILWLFKFPADRRRGSDLRRAERLDHCSGH